jgi:anti-sigma regulatory factor (Ser/Thr protein kinase)
MKNGPLMSKPNGETLLRADYTVQGGDFNRAGEVSTDIKARLKKIGFDPDLVRRVAIASFEAEMNVVMYAESAAVLLEVTPERIFVEYRDKGPGIPDIELAMQEGYSTATPEMRKLGYGAGMGLPTIKRNAGDFSIESEVGQGTVVNLYFTP